MGALAACPEALRRREAHAAPRLRLGARRGPGQRKTSSRGSGRNRPEEHLRVRPVAVKQRALRSLSMGRVSEAAGLECGDRRPLASSGRPA